MTSSHTSIVRFVTFVTIIIFAVIVLCLSADFISLTEQQVPPYYYTFSGFALATSLLTVFTITPMLVIDLLRQGSFFSYVVVEIVWLSVLWVFWLSSGSYTAWMNGQFYGPSQSCNFGVLGQDGLTDSEISFLTQTCQEIKAIMAFSFLSWILLLAYTNLLLVLAICAQGRGYPVWTRGVRDGPLLRPPEKVMATPTQVPLAPATIPQSYPPPPQPTLPSSISYATQPYPPIQV